MPRSPPLDGPWAHRTMAAASKPHLPLWLPITCSKRTEALMPCNQSAVCFAVLLSVGACLAPSTNTKWQMIFLKRAMLCAMTKHLAGLLAATGMTATAIPKVGLGQARRWMEQLARDPVSQYVFYAALMLVWLSSTPSHRNDDGFRTYPWWASTFRLVLVGPIFLREAISVTFVVSDILLLAASNVVRS